MKETQNIESKFNHDENNNRSEGNGRSAEDGGVVLEHFELVQKNLENIPKNIFAAPGGWSTYLQWWLLGTSTMAVRFIIARLLPVTQMARSHAN